MGAQRWAPLLALGLACAAFFAAVQFATPNLVGTDGYFHIRFAEVMRERGLTPDFVWLPLTILNPNQYVDHHFLFHILLIPFTGGDLIVGAKWASVVFAAAAGAALGWVLRRERVPYAPLWTLGALAISEAFIYRMSMPRVQSLSLAMLLLALGVLLGRRFRLLLPLAFVYVWLYDAFPLLLLICVSYTAAEWLVKGRLRLAPLGYAAAGIALGLVLNPYFPENLLFIARHFLPKLTETTSIRVGNEWFPYDTAQLLRNAGLALLLFSSGIVALGLSGRRMTVSIATALLFSLAVGFMLFQARRFIEYFPPFALIFAALAWSPVLERLWTSRAEPLPAAEAGHGRVGALTRLGLVSLMVAALALALSINLRASQESVRGSRSARRYQAAAAWLATNTPAGARVFQTDWDDFPRLFFHNTHNTYTIGLDPTYMQLHDAELYEHWVDLTQGKAEDLSASIRETFGASYALSDLDHERFLKAAADDPQMREVYRDEFAVVFAVELTQR